MSILYVQSNKFDKRFLTSALQSIDPSIHCVVVNDANELLETLNDLVQLPELIIISIDTAFKEAETCLIAIRNSPVFQQMHVAILTGAIGTSEMQFFHSLGASLISGPDAIQTFCSTLENLQLPLRSPDLS